MIRLVIVGGSSSERLAEFMKSHGTFELIDHYSSLTDNLTLIQAKIIDTDKLLYLYHVDEASGDADINIKSDMQALRTLLGNEDSRAFFKVGEIDFVTGTGKMSSSAVRYFKTVMQDCAGVSYNIKTIEGRITFSSVYDAIMGVSANKDFGNKWIANYKVERNAEADLEYGIQNDTDMIVEPFRFDNVKNYERRQQTSARIDSGNVYKCSGDTEQEQLNDPDFSSVSAGVFLKRCKVVLISGRDKSGKSVWAAQLAASAQKCGVTACMLDFTHNGDVGRLLSQSDIPFSELGMLQLLQLVRVEEGTLTYCRCANASERSVRFEFMQNFIGRQTEHFGSVLAAVDYRDLARMHFLLGNKVDDVLIACVPTVDDIAFHQEALLPLTAASRVSILLNECVELMEGQSYASVDEIKSVNDENIRLVKSMKFNNMQAKSGIYRSLVMA